MIYAMSKKSDSNERFNLRFGHQAQAWQQTRAVAAKVNR
jgi:hypothetical protein